MNEIKLLPENLINLIAAGEVVERPASVVKELLENSIDAGSTQITVKLEDFGNALIEITDNGKGIRYEDANLVFAQHATSKIFAPEDLNNIATLGFRGEALASISEVAGKIEVASKKEGSKALLLKKQNGNVETIEGNRVENGTTVSVFNLFEKIPARKKFLKTSATEFRNISNIFINIALIHLNIHFELYNNNRLIYRLPKAENFIERVFQIWGKEVAGNLKEVSFYESPDFNFKMYLGMPEIAKKSNTPQISYVNNRYIANKVISGAVIEGFKGFIHRELKPAFFALIHISPAEIDVNIHPRKLEISFADNGKIFKSLFLAVKNTLEKSTRNLVIEKTEDVPAPTSTPSFVVEQKHFPNTQKDFPYKKDFGGRIKEALNFTETLLKDTNNFNKAEPVSIIQNERIEPYQIFNTYIVYENSSYLIFIDQHAAAEKISFEKLYSNWGKPISKPLLVPEIIDLNQEEKEIVLEKAQELAEFGLVINDLGGSTIQIKEIPEYSSKIEFSSFFKELIDENSSFEGMYESYKSIYSNINREIFLILATTACHTSIRAGQKLNREEMLNIIRNLKTLKNPYNCPHGRPVMWEMPKGDLEKNFKRKL